MNYWIIRDPKVRQALRQEWSISDRDLRNAVQLQAERYMQLRRSADEARLTRASTERVLSLWSRWLQSPLAQRFLRARSA